MNHPEVSRRIREEYENGRDYYALHGRELWLPRNPKLAPAKEFLQEHNERIYLG